MYKVFVSLALIVLSGFVQPANASDRLVIDGLQALQAGNADKAMEIWLEDSLLKRSGKTEQITQQLIGVRQLCGRLDGWSPLKTKSYGSQTTESFYVFHFERCPIFARFMTYTTDGRETLVRFNINAAPEQILEFQN